MPMRFVTQYAMDKQGQHSPTPSAAGDLQTTPPNTSSSSIRETVSLGSRDSAGRDGGAGWSSLNQERKVSLYFQKEHLEPRFLTYT